MRGLLNRDFFVVLKNRAIAHDQLIRGLVLCSVAFMLVLSSLELLISDWGFLRVSVTLW
jgi:hypothetical protein